MNITSNKILNTNTIFITAVAHQASFITTSSFNKLRSVDLWYNIYTVCMIWMSSLKTYIISPPVTCYLLMIWIWLVNTDNDAQLSSWE